jgi:hypothetical protein
MRTELGLKVSELYILDLEDLELEGVETICYPEFKNEYEPDKSSSCLDAPPLNHM